jgi:hypothetical protein
MMLGRDLCVKRSIADKSEFCTTKGAAGYSETTEPGVSMGTYILSSRWDSMATGLTRLLTTVVHVSAQAFASYCVEAGLATLYMLFILLDRF